MRYARLALALVASSIAVAPLTGCVITDHNFYPGAYPASTTATARPSSQVFEMTGASLFDAQHAVNRYLSLHYPQADLVRIHALMVGTNAKLAKTSAWEFTYRVRIQTVEATTSPTPIPTPSASPSFTAQVTIPTSYQYRLLNFTYTGTGQLLAPEEVDDTGDTLAKIDFDRALLLSKAIDTALDIGMGVGDPGMEVTLRTTVNGGAVYELDSSVGTRQVLAHMATYPSYPSYDSSYDSWGGDDEYSYYSKPAPKPAPTPTAKTAYVRGKYILDAYTGAILDRPNRL